MKISVIFILCAIFNLPNIVAAEWVQVSDNETQTFYADPATIRKAGNRVKIWELNDFKIAQETEKGKPYMSIKLQKEYDCKEAQWRFLFFSLHSGPMGRGEVVPMESSPTKWQPVPPESISETRWEFACRKPRLSTTSSSAPSLTEGSMHPSTKRINAAVKKMFTEYGEHGISGVQIIVSNCYSNLGNQRIKDVQLAKVEFCAGMDLAAQELDDAMARVNRFPPDEYFLPANVVSRLTSLEKYVIISSNVIEEWRKIAITALNQEMLMNLPSKYIERVPR